MPRPSFTDTFERRVKVRLAYLGWTQCDLGAAIAIDERRASPISPSTVRGAITESKRYPLSTWLPRISRALGVLGFDLTPGQTFSGLVSDPIAGPVRESR